MTSSIGDRGGSDLYPEPRTFRKPSAESSPPPSPQLEPNTQNDDPMKPPSQPSLTLLASPSTLSVPSTERPKLHSREVTPPSPPSSLFLNESGVSPTSTTSPNEIMGTPPFRPPPTVEATPPSSVLGKISSIFRVRATSNASIASFRRHRKGGSDSTANTSNINPFNATPVGSSPPSIHNMDADNPRPFYSEQPSSKARSRQNSIRGGQQLPRRTVMNGGEVRVQIIQQRVPTITPETEEPLKLDDAIHDTSEKYYDYYTRSHGSVPSVEHEIDPNGADIGIPRISGLSRRKTVATQSSGGSQERRDAEHTASTFGFQGFHLGVIVRNDEVDPPLESPGIIVRNEDVHSPESGVASSSGKASSSLLVRSESAVIPLTKDAPNRTDGPDIARNKLYGGVGIAAVGSNSDDVTREIKRLSKISAGSGVSGMAIVITADGAASMRVPADESGDEYSYTERKWTREEKGKGRATSSVPSGLPSKSSRQDSSLGHRSTDDRPSSRQSQSSSGHNTTHDSELGDDDSQSLIPGGGEPVPLRKLRAQEPSKDVLVHRGDPNFDL